jgi:uncharacterized protein (DUF1697 family)
MPELREGLEGAGFSDVRTYVQSGNVVVSSRASPERIAREVNAVIKERFGFDITVLVRSRAELADVVRRNPLSKVAVDPKRHLVTFLASELPGELIDRMSALAGDQEQLRVIGREVYSWHPAGVGRSPLWERLGGKALGVAATSRNWTTVTTLLAMAGDSTSR